MTDLSRIKKTKITSVVSNLEPEVKIGNSPHCGHIDQIKNLILNVKDLNQNKVIQRLNKSCESETKNFVNFVDEFSHLTVNDGYYSVKSDDFKLHMLPILLKTGSNSPEKQLCAILLLEKILFDDWKLRNAKLSLIAVKESLIPQLINLYEDNNGVEVRKAIYRLYLLLFFVIAKDYKKIRKLILKYDRLLTCFIKNLNETNDINIIKDTLLLLQFYPIWSKKFDEISIILNSIIKFIGHSDKSIVSQSCYTLLMLSQNCKDSRFAIIKASIAHKLVDLLLNCDSVHCNLEEDLVKPIIGLFMTFLPLSNVYKNEFLKANILSIVTKYVNSCECQKRYASDIIKMICMNPICSKLDKPTQQIQQIIDSKTLLLIYDLLQNDEKLDVKFCALNAIFVVVYEANTEQLRELVNQGCLKALCSQLESLDYKFVYQILITLTIILFDEFKDILINKKYFPDPQKSLTDFASIIKDNDGIQKLKLIVDRQKEILKSDPNHKEAKEISKVAQEILNQSFDIKTEPTNKIPEAEVKKEKKSVIDCDDCIGTSADTILSACGHIAVCSECTSKALKKIYSIKLKKCLVCKESVPASGTPWHSLRNKPFSIYKKFEDQVVFEFESK